MNVLSILDLWPWPIIEEVELPDPPLNPNVAKPGVLRVQQAVRPNGAAIEYGPLKVKQSCRPVQRGADNNRTRVFSVGMPAVGRTQNGSARLLPGGRAR